MTSGQFQSVVIGSIVIERGDRQRHELTKIDELAESIFRIGLINPIVITQDYVLVAGERPQCSSPPNASKSRPSFHPLSPRTP